MPPNLKPSPPWPKRGYNLQAQALNLKPRNPKPQSPKPQNPKLLTQLELGPGAQAAVQETKPILERLQV